jgi:outer membrane protein assembly factor BamB
MIERALDFDNNEGCGGFEKGAYDKYSYHPTDANWTRQSKFLIPDRPKLLWKISTDNAYVDQTNVSGSFVVDSNKNVIVSDCDNNIIGQHFGRLIQIDSFGEKKEIFKTNMRLKSPIIGENGFLYLTTTDSMDTIGHKLFCLYPDGSLRWECLITDNAYSKPVIDESGNIYIFTYGNTIGTLYSISNNGIINWEYKFNSINWHDPIISKDGVIYIGLSLDQTLCAFSKSGQKIWERELGNGLGSYPPNISRDGTIHVCLSNVLYALNPDGSIKWKYTPAEGNVVTTPAINKKGDLYINLSALRLASLNSEGKEHWLTTVNGAVTMPPIIGKCNKLYQQSFMQRYPEYISWINVFSDNGKEKWTFELNGTIVSTVLADDNLLYILSNCHTYSKKGWKDKMDVKWELYAIGNE